MTLPVIGPGASLIDVAALIPRGHGVRKLVPVALIDGWLEATQRKA